MLRPDQTTDAKTYFVFKRLYSPAVGSSISGSPQKMTLCNHIVKGVDTKDTPVFLLLRR